MKIAKRCVACDGTRLACSPAILMPFVAARVFGWEPVAITPEWGFRDISPGQACSVCNSVMCDDCGMLFLDMRFDDEEMGALYTNYRGTEYTALRKRFEPDYGARNAIYAHASTYLPDVENFLRPHLPVVPRILDWGGDSGINTPFRSDATCQHIYDISGCALIDGAASVTLEDARRNDYDVIVSMQVLEHVPSPHALLAEIVSVMKQETLFYVELPYEAIVRTIASRCQRLDGKRHWHEHINFFTPEALEALIARVGLKVVDRTTLQINAGGKDGHIFSILTRLV